MKSPRVCLGSVLGPTSFSLGLLVLAPDASAGRILVSDTSPGLDRTAAPGASNAQWLLGRMLAVGGDTPALSIMTGATSGSVLGYFTPAGYPATIAIGETLTVSFVFTLGTIGSANGMTALRIGLFDSNGSRAGDGFPSPGAAFVNYTGYAALLCTRASGSGITIRERVTGSNHLLSSTSNPPFTNAAQGATGASHALVAGTSYTVTLSATRTGVQTVDFRIAFSGGDFGSYSLGYTDTGSPTMAFDTVSIGWAANMLAADGAVTLESLAVEISGGEPPEADGGRGL